MTDEKQLNMIGKIEKLYQLAKNNPSEAQSEAALLKANELMTIHNIDMQMLDFDKKQSQEYIKGEKLYGKMPVEASYIRTIIDTYFFVKTIGSPQRGNTVLNFIGTRKNVKIAMYVFEQLIGIFKTNWQLYKILNDAPTTAKQAYYLGVQRGLMDKLKMQRGKIEESMAMVIVVDPDLEAAKHKMFPRLTSVTKRYKADGGAAAGGYAAGQQINIAAGITGASQGRIG